MSSPPNHIEADIAKHNTKANKWWSPESLLVKMTPIRVQFVCDAVKKGNEPKNSSLLKEFKLLDAGCGGGLMSEALAALGADVTGVDVSDVLLKVAKEHAQGQSELQNNMPKYVLSSIEEFAENSTEKYDIVVASEIVEHVNNHETLLKACCQLLRPGGSLIVTTPFKTWKSWWYSIVWMEQILGVITPGTHDYKLYCSPEDLTKILHKYNCSTKEVRPYGYTHSKKIWEWGNEVWYALHAQKDV